MTTSGWTVIHFSLNYFKTLPVWSNIRSTLTAMSHIHIMLQATGGNVWTPCYGPRSHTWLLHLQGYLPLRSEPDEVGSWWTRFWWSGFHSDYGSPTVPGDQIQLWHPHCTRRRKCPMLQKLYPLPTQCITTDANNDWFRKWQWNPDQGLNSTTFCTRKSFNCYNKPGKNLLRLHLKVQSKHSKAIKVLNLSN